MEDNIDPSKYWTILIRPNGRDEDIRHFEVRILNLLDSQTSIAQNLEDYTVSFVGYTGNEFELYYQGRGIKESYIRPDIDLGFGDGVPRVRVSEIVGKGNISAGGSESFSIRVDANMRNSVTLNVEDTRPFEITDGLRQNNLDIDIGKLESAQSCELN